MPLFLQLRPLADEGDGRYLQGRVQQVHLPDRQLGAACARFGGLALPEAEKVCGAGMRGHEDPGRALPTALQSAFGQLRESFVEPVRATLDRIAGQQQLIDERLSKDDLLSDAQALTESRASVADYLSAFAMEAAPRGGPQPLQCLAAAFPAAWQAADEAGTRARLALWVAAVLDGTQASALLDARAEAALAGTREPGCAGFGSTLDAGEALAALVGRARGDSIGAGKADAMRHLLKNAWWQWVAWSFLGLALVLLARRASAVWPATGAVLCAWGIAAWASRVWLPLPDALNTAWTRLHFVALAVPPWPVVVLVVAGAATWVAGAALGRTHARAQPVPQGAASVLGYAGWLLFAGLGWLVLLDLSATGHPRNRFLALYQQGFLWGAFAILCLATVWRQPIGRGLLRMLATGQALGSTLARRRPRGYWFWQAFLVGAVVGAFALMQNLRQFTSELARLCLVLAVAWLFHLRMDLAFELPRGARWRHLLAFLAPLGMVLATLVLAMLVTDDNGPLLVVGYAGMVFLAAATMYGVQQRGGRLAVALPTGLAVLVAGCWVLTETLYAFGSAKVLVARRLEAAANPLISTNDQIGLISWFRQATPPFGYGVGNVPWCGHAGGNACRGVPLQIQSDYSFTALWGVLGELGAWLFVAFCVAWIAWLIKGHAGATSGNAGAHRGEDGMLAADHQGLLGWICVTWLVLCLLQMAITVAGNLRVLPLTGITYPFVSFGKTSLWVNVFLLGLCLSVDRRREAARG
ncbi:MAG: FtsW/RodA/SpoVE family cell cycle protein [Pseudomonadota bacterium]